VAVREGGRTIIIRDRLYQKGEASEPDFKRRWRHRKPGALQALSPPALSRRHAGVRHRLPPGPFDIPDPL